MTVARILKAGTKILRVAPGGRLSEGRARDTRKGVNLTDGFLIEIDDLQRSFTVGHRRDINGENALRLETSAGGLKSEKSGDQSSGAREKHERGGDLSDGEGALAAAGAAGDADAAARYVEAVGLVSGRQARDEGQDHGGENGEPRSDQEQAGIDLQIHRADRETRGVASEDRDKRLRDDHADCRASAAQDKAFG